MLPGSLPGAAALCRAATLVHRAGRARAVRRTIRRTGQGEGRRVRITVRRDDDLVVARAARHCNARVGVVQRRLDRLEGRLGAAGVRAVVVGRTGLHRLGRSHASGLGLGVVALAPLVQERGNCDRGKDADDQNDDQELDQREASLFLGAMAKLPQHWLLLVLGAGADPAEDMTAQAAFHRCIGRPEVIFTIAVVPKNLGQQPSGPPWRLAPPGAPKVSLPATCDYFALWPSPRPLQIRERTLPRGGTWSRRRLRRSADSSRSRCRSDLRP